MLETRDRAAINQSIQEMEKRSKKGAADREKKKREAESSKKIKTEEIEYEYSCR